MATTGRDEYLKFARIDSPALMWLVVLAAGVVGSPVDAAAALVPAVALAVAGVDSAMGVAAAGPVVAVSVLPVVTMPAAAHRSPPTLSRITRLRAPSDPRRSMSAT